MQERLHLRNKYFGDINEEEDLAEEIADILCQEQDNNNNTNLQEVWNALLIGVISIVGDVQHCPSTPCSFLSKLFYLSNNGWILLGSLPGRIRETEDPIEDSDKVTCHDSATITLNWQEAHVLITPVSRMLRNYVCG